MKIKILQLLEGAKRAEGLAVIIDVFRAFTVACHVIENGAKKIITVKDVETAFRLKDENPGYILIGERNESIVPGFDFGNHPSRISDVDFTGKTVVLTTSAGTRGIVYAAKNTDEIITGSFINAGAIVRYIRERGPDVVSLVCMGYSATCQVEEDTFCAEYIKNALENRDSDFERMVEIIKATSGRRFFDPATMEHSPPEDFYLCMQLNVFDFVLKVRRDEKNLLALFRENV